jgi:hypothetical protein
VSHVLVQMLFRDLSRRVTLPQSFVDDVVGSLGKQLELPIGRPITKRTCACVRYRRDWSLRE